MKEFIELIESVSNEVEIPCYRDCDDNSVLSYNAGVYELKNALINKIKEVKE